MKKLILMTLFATSFCLINVKITSAVAAEKAQSDKHRLAGKFQVAADKYKKIAPEGYFFVIVNESGETLAFPVSFNKAEDRKKVAANLDKTFILEGERSTLTTLNDSSEVVQKVHVLKVTKLDEVDLGELSPSKVKIADTNQAGKPMEKPADIRQDKPRSPTVSGLNDKKTNALIFTAGAILLGSMLSK